MKNALVLSGGGARAAYQVGVLKALAEILPEESHNPFPVICGTSAGAINAVTIASHEGPFREGVEKLVRVWEGLDPEDIYRYGWLEMGRGLGRFIYSLFNQGVGRAQPIALLDNSPLRELIQREVPFNQIDRAIARGDLEAVCVTAMGYSTGRSVCFFQGRPELEGWQRYRRIGRRTLLDIDHLMASSAIPTLFPTTRIEHEYFGDGALRQLSPISPALHLGADRVFIIGVSGNRDPKLLNRKTPTRHSPSVAQILGHMFNSAFVDSLEGDIEHLDRINQLVSMIPQEVLEEKGLTIRPIESMVISPSQPVDKIAGRNVRYLPDSLRFFLRITGATASGGGAAAASYLLFAKPFIDEMIAMGYRDTMWEIEPIRRFFDLEDQK